MNGIKKQLKEDFRILFLPCHYVYDEIEHGSEQGVSFEVADRIANKFPKSQVITGTKNILKPKKYKIIEVQKGKKVYQISLVKNSIPFALRYQVVGAYLLLKNKYDLIHHVRPFKLGATFNLPILFNLHQAPFVIGSFTSGYTKEDEDPKLTQGFINIAWNTVEKIITPFIRILSYETLKKADKVIVYNVSTLKQVSKYVNKNKIIVIPSGLDGKKYNPSKTNTSKIELISVGYFLPRKRFDVLIESFAHVAKESKKLQLRIIGDGPEKKNLQKLIKKLGLEKQVILQGFVPHNKIHEFYKKASIFCSTQKEESFGQVYVEAMASGLPIITTSNTGSREIVKKEFGYLIPQDDIKGFADKVKLLTKNPKLIEKMSIKAREEFEKKYDWENVIIPKYLKVYKEVLKK